MNGGGYCIYDCRKMNCYQSLTDGHPRRYAVRRRSTQMFVLVNRDFMSLSSNLVNQSKPSVAPSSDLPQLIDIEFKGVNPTVRGQKQIEKIVDYLIKKPGTAISLTGAATPQGSVKNNQKLAVKRADRIKKIIEFELKKNNQPADNRVFIGHKNNLQASRSSVEVGTTRVEIRSTDGKAAVSFFPFGSLGQKERNEIRSRLNLISISKNQDNSDMTDQQRRKLLDNLARDLVGKGYVHVLYGGYDHPQPQQNPMPGPMRGM